MGLRNYANAPATTLSSSCTSGATTINVTATTGFPISYPYTIIVDRGLATEEVMSVTNAAGTALTVVRGYDTTTAFAHSLGASVVHGFSAIDPREANAHVNATAAIHGVAGTIVGTTDTQTLTNKTIALGSNTVSGTKAQFNTAISDADMATLAGAEILTNKTINLTNNTLECTIAQMNTALSDGDFATQSGVETLNSKSISLGGNTITGTKAQFDTACSDADFASLAGTETLTNKTLTSPALTTPVIGGATLTKIQKGNGTCVFTAEAGPVSVAVTFGSAFSVAPEVTLGSQNNTTIFWATAITTTGFTLNARQFDGVSRSISPVCSYTAMV